MCKKPSNFAKNFPKEEKAAKLLKQAQIHVEDTPFLDVESLFSFDDDYSPQGRVVMAYSTSEEDSNSNSYDASDLEILTIYTSQPIIAPLTNPQKPTLDPFQLQPFLTLELQQQCSILRFYLQNSSYPITRCSMQQMEKNS